MNNQKLAKNIAMTIHEKFIKYQKGEAMDGDQTENFAKTLLVELNLLNGNITNTEYLSKIKKLI